MNTNSILETSDETGTVTVFNTDGSEPSFLLLNANFNDFAILINQYRCTKVAIHAITAGNPVDLNILNENTSVRSLSLNLAHQSNTLLYSASTHRFFSQLKELEVKGLFTPDFPSFNLMTDLDRLDVEYDPRHSDWDTHQGISDLIVHHHDDTDLRQLGRMTSLRRLRLVQSKCVSLDGIQNIQQLETLHVVEGRRLRDISALLLAPQLRNLNFESFSGITDWDFLVGMPQLVYLSLYNVKNIDFISRLPNLVYFNASKFDGKAFPTRLFDSIQGKLQANTPRVQPDRNLPFFAKLER